MLGECFRLKKGCRTEVDSGCMCTLAFLLYLYLFAWARRVLYYSVYCIISLPSHDATTGRMMEDKHPGCEYEVRHSHNLNRPPTWAPVEISQLAADHHADLVS